MRSVKNFCYNILLLLCLCSFFTSCADGTGKKQAAADIASPPSEKGAWTNPRKGKIWSKVNVMQIPLTAYENHILGKVKTVSYKRYVFVESPENAKRLVDSGYNVYSEAGYLTDQNEYNADGSQRWNCTYQYDSNNKSIGWDFQFYELKEHTRTVFRYDSKGNQVEATTYNAENKLTDRETITYDDKGNDLEHIAYDRSGEVIRTETYKYDANGRQVELVQKFTGKTPSKKITVEYDPKGNQVSGATYRNDTGKLVKWMGKNDGEGRCVQRTTYKADGSLYQNITIKYDRWNNETESITYNEDASLNEDASYFDEYVYDAKGNATRQTTYKIRYGKRIATDYIETTYTYY